jgi:hypothetical protein
MVGGREAQDPSPALGEANDPTDQPCSIKAVERVAAPQRRVLAKYAAAAAACTSFNGTPTR